MPVFTHKPDTDAMYEKLTRVMLEAADVVRPAFASHNVRSLAVAIETARELGLPQDAFEIQMLHGMGDPIKTAVARHGAARCASTRRWGSSSRAWPTWSAGCSRTPPTTRSCGRRSWRGPPSTS